MAEILHVLKSGDTFPSIRVSVKDSLDEAVNLSGASVDFVMVRNTGEVLVDAPATVVDAAAGEVVYDWEVGDTDEPGKYRAEFIVTFSDGRVMTAPNGEFIEILIVRGLS